MYDWRNAFVEAAEPEGGWPARPWDHWFVDAVDGMVERVAVVDGEPVLDAEGDEVMSGPGFGHLAVKSVPMLRSVPGVALVPLADPSGLDVASLVRASEVFPALESFLSAAADEAAHHGHPWVGEEHVAIVLARGDAPFDDRSVAELDRTVAGFYEGPHAAARVRIVEARRGGERFVRQPLASFVVSYSLRLLLPLLAHAANGGRLEETAAYLLGRPGRASGVLARAS